MNKIEILDRAINALQNQTGLQKEKYSHFDKENQWIDYKISLRTPQENQLKHHLAIVRKNINLATIGEIAVQSQQTPNKLVLIAEYVSQPQAMKLKELGISFFDTAGNTYFNEPGLYIFITGQKIESTKERVPRLFRPPGIKLLFAFLTNPELPNKSYRAISTATGVPTPTVGVFMGDLEKAGYLIKRANNERNIVRRKELFRRWVENYGESFRPTLNPVRFHSTKHEGRWWENVDIKDYNACWGGETGATILTGHLKPEIATIYSDSLLPRFQAKYGLVRDKFGNIEILNKFWTGGEIGDAAPPLVIYADLMLTADRRNLETAQMIYERYLADIAETNSCKPFGNFNFGYDGC